MVAWSKERQINRFTLHNWIEEYRRESKPAAQKCEWLEVNVNTTKDNIVTINEEALRPTTRTYTPIRITIGNIQVEVTTGFDEAALAAVIKAVNYQC